MNIREDVLAEQLADQFSVVAAAQPAAVPDQGAPGLPQGHRPAWGRKPDRGLVQGMQQFAGLGGTTFGAAARMLELLLSQEVAVQFSWAGQKGKRKFVDLGVTNAIC
ncbi:hypothetical protein MTO96_035721, partial [Rhipicephalus appendiculatus]